MAEEKSQELNVWPKHLLLDQQVASAVACRQCDGIPMNGMSDGQGQIFCKQCSESRANVTLNAVVQVMVKNLNTRCLSRKNDEEQVEGVENSDEGHNIFVGVTAGNELNEAEAPPSCQWTGTVQEWQQHQQECAYACVQCAQCGANVTPRNAMQAHMNICPNALIACPQLCGESMPRKDKNEHISRLCKETLIDCSNDDCKMQIKRQDYLRHMSSDCEERIVECPFAAFGCDATNVKAGQLQQHMDDTQIVHLSKKLDFVTAQQNQTNLKLAAENEELKQKFADISMRFDQLQAAVLKIRPSFSADDQKDAERVVNKKSKQSVTENEPGMPLAKAMPLSTAAVDTSSMEFVWSSHESSDDILVLNQKTITLYPKSRPNKGYNTILLSPAIPDSAKYVFLFEFQGALDWAVNLISIGIVHARYPQRTPYMGERGIGGCTHSYAWYMGEGKVMIHHKSQPKETYLGYKLRDGMEITLSVQNTTNQTCQMSLHLGYQLVATYKAAFAAHKVAVTMLAGKGGKQMILKLIKCTRLNPT